MMYMIASDMMGMIIGMMKSFILNFPVPKFTSRPTIHKQIEELVYVPVCVPVPVLKKKMRIID